MHFGLRRRVRKKTSNPFLCHFIGIPNSHRSWIEKSAENCPKNTFAYGALLCQCPNLSVPIWSLFFVCPRAVIPNESWPSGHHFSRNSTLLGVASRNRIFIQRHISRDPCYYSVYTFQLLLRGQGRQKKKRLGKGKTLEKTGIFHKSRSLCASESDDILRCFFFFFSPPRFPFCIHTQTHAQRRGPERFVSCHLHEKNSLPTGAMRIRLSANTSFTTKSSRRETLLLVWSSLLLDDVNHFFFFFCPPSVCGIYLNRIADDFLVFFHQRRSGKRG